MRRVDVIATDEFKAWYDSLDDGDESAVYRSVELLSQAGVVLGHPHSSKINGSKHSGMRELRVQSQGEPIRIFYIFSEEQNAVLLLGGNKTGNDRFYAEFVPVADQIYDRYVEERRPIIEAAKKVKESQAAKKKAPKK